MLKNKSLLLCGGILYVCFETRFFQEVMSKQGKIADTEKTELFLEKIVLFFLLHFKILFFFSSNIGQIPTLPAMRNRKKLELPKAIKFTTIY